MYTLDIIILLLMVPSVIRGLKKGFVDQGVALVSLVVSGYLAYLFADKVGAWLSTYIHVSDTFLYIIGFAVIVIVCSFLFNLLAKMVSDLLARIGLGWLDKLLGILVGILFTMIAVGLVLRLFTNLNSQYFQLGTSWMDSSVLYGWCKAVADWVFPFLSEFFSTVKSNVL